MIILANEEELLKRADKQKYLDMKEKTIGQTLTVRSTVAEALSTFLALVQHEKTKTFLDAHVEQLRVLHAQSETENLRLLKQALWDFERLGIRLKDKYWENQEAVSVLFQVIVSLSFEVRSGRMAEADLGEFAPGDWRRFLRRDEDEPTLVDRLEKRYPEVEFSQTMLRPSQLKSLLFDGRLDDDLLEKTLDESSYFASPASQPSWKVAWHGWDLSDSDYEEAVARVEEEFKKRAFVTVGEIFHVFGLRLHFVRVGAIQLTTTEVIDQCKDYLKDLQRSGQFPDPFIETHDGFTRTGSEGLGYMEGESPEFKTIRDYFDRLSDEVKGASLPDRGHALLSLLTENPQKYFRLLCANNFESAIYYNTPVLAHIDPKLFVQTVLSATPSTQNLVFTTFKARYEAGHLRAALAPEEDWLKKVKNLFEDKLAAAGNMTRYRLSMLVERNIDRYLTPKT